MQSALPCDVVHVFGVMIFRRLRSGVRASRVRFKFLGMIFVFVVLGLQPSWSR